MSSDFLQSLPGLEPGQTFCFDCHPGVSCFNTCCADLDLVLSPYDVLRLRGALKIGAVEFLEQFALVGVPPDNGPPQVFLKMQDDQKKTCPFVGESGCRVYPDRPGACRIYPLGRCASADDQGRVTSWFVLVREDHCRGFDDSRTWTPLNWMQDQGLEEYNRFNDRYLELINRWRLRGRPLTREQFTRVLNDLYQADDLNSAFESAIACDP